MSVVNDASIPGAKLSKRKKHLGAYAIMQFVKHQQLEFGSLDLSRANISIYNIANCLMKIFYRELRIRIRSSISGCTGSEVRL